MTVALSIPAMLHLRERPVANPEVRLELTTPVTLFFLAPDAKLMAVPVRASDSTFEAGSPAALFQTRTVVGGSADLMAQYAVSRDGRFLFNVPDDTSTAAPITLVLNWNPGLKP